jgi:hypothetical protein
LEGGRRETWKKDRGIRRWGWLGMGSGGKGTERKEEETRWESGRGIGRRGELEGESVVDTEEEGGDWKK